MQGFYSLTKRLCSIFCCAFLSCCACFGDSPEALASDLLQELNKVNLQWQNDHEQQQNLINDLLTDNQNLNQENQALKVDLQISLDENSSLKKENKLVIAGITISATISLVSVSALLIFAIKQ